MWKSTPRCCCWLVKKNVFVPYHLYKCKPKIRMSITIILIIKLFKKGGGVTNKKKTKTLYTSHVYATCVSLLLLCYILLDLLNITLTIKPIIVSCLYTSIILRWEYNCLSMKTKLTFYKNFSFLYSGLSLFSSYPWCSANVFCGTL